MISQDLLPRLSDSLSAIAEGEGKIYYVYTYCILIYFIKSRTQIKNCRSTQTRIEVSKRGHFRTLIVN